ncbi:MAG: hypothetical protein ACE5Q6_04675 [Dehalococcoidia bacterium]
MVQAVAQPQSADSKEQVRYYQTVLREYAKWCLLRGYSFPPSRETHRVELVKEFFELGQTFKLTEREMVLLLFRGLFPATV